MPDPIIPAAGPMFSQADLNQFISDPRFANSRYANIVRNAFINDPDFADSRYANIAPLFGTDQFGRPARENLLDWLATGDGRMAGRMISDIAPYLAGGLAATGLGAQGYAEGKLRQLGRQVLAEQAARSLSKKYNANANEILSVMRGGQFSGAPSPKLMQEISARQSGNSIFNVLTKSGRQAGKRRKALEALDYKDLLEYAYGGGGGQQGRLPAKVGQAQAAYDAAVEAFEKNPAIAPVPGKRPRQINLPSAEDLAKAETRYGMQRGAGMMAEASRPGILSSKAFDVFGKVAKTPVRRAIRGGLTAGVAALPQLAGLAADYIVPKVRANQLKAQQESQEQIKKATEASSKPPLLKMDDIRKEIFNQSVDVFRLTDGKLTLNPNATEKQIRTALRFAINTLRNNRSRYEPIDYTKMLNGLTSWEKL